MDNIRNVVMMGSGCAGHTAALYTARANFKPLVLEGHEPGGQLSLTTLVENFPGFPEGIQGPELIENMRKQASRFGAEYQHGHVTSADLSQQPFKLQVGHQVVHTRTLIIASGASARWLGVPESRQLIGHGVSSCATCDGFFFSGKEIAVVGGGDSAMEEAIFLTRFATKVTLIHRRDQFRASKIMLDRAQHNDKITFHALDTVVEEVNDVYKKEVTSLKLAKSRRRAKFGISPPAHMFLGIGHIPNAKIFEGQLDTDQRRLSEDDNTCLHPRPRRLCLRRRARPPLPTSHHRRRFRMHGRAGSGKIPGRTSRVRSAKKILSSLTKRSLRSEGPMHFGAA